ncbi:hypothetical protein B0O99DRAFT_690442 [Bisporella sp. PMI_857]|nr:hypothetical protein B0O99DRAFT_690442 [Bisporella sp. PMI_857]
MVDQTPITKYEVAARVKIEDESREAANSLNAMASTFPYTLKYPTSNPCQNAVTNPALYQTPNRVQSAVSITFPSTAQSTVVQTLANTLHNTSTLFQMTGAGGQQLFGQPETSGMVTRTSQGAPPTPKTRVTNLCVPQGFVEFTVGVEPNTQRFVVHKAAVAQSPYFEKMFNSNLEEGQTQKMVANSIDGRIFGMVVNWLYTKTIQNAEGKTPTKIEMARLWMYGMMFSLPAMQNAAIDKMIQHGQWYSLSDDYEELFQVVYLTETETPLKRLVVYWAVNLCCIGNNATEVKQNTMAMMKIFPSKMLNDVILAMAVRQTVGETPPGNPKNKLTFRI